METDKTNRISKFSQLDDPNGQKPGNSSSLLMNNDFIHPNGPLNMMNNNNISIASSTVLSSITQPQQQTPAHKSTSPSSSVSSNSSNSSSASSGYNSLNTSVSSTPSNTLLTANAGTASQETMLSVNKIKQCYGQIQPFKKISEQLNLNLTYQKDNAPRSSLVLKNDKEAISKAFDSLTKAASNKNVNNIFICTYIIFSFTYLNQISS